jgi:hypothetical protein
MYVILFVYAVVPPHTWPSLLQGCSSLLGRGTFSIILPYQCSGYKIWPENYIITGMGFCFEKVAF